MNLRDLTERNLDRVQRLDQPLQNRPGLIPAVPRLPLRDEAAVGIVVGHSCCAAMTLF